MVVSGDILVMAVGLGNIVTSQQDLHHDDDTLQLQLHHLQLHPSIHWLQTISQKGDIEYNS